MTMTKAERTVYDRAVLIGNKYQKKCELMQKQIQNYIGYLNTLYGLKGETDLELADVLKMFRELNDICTD